MKKTFVIAMAAATLFSGCAGQAEKQEKGELKADSLFTPTEEEFDYIVETVADIQILRYRVAGIEGLSLQQQELAYYLSEAALCGRDILVDQNGKYNLAIRSLLERVYTSESVDKTSDDYKALEIYLKRMWVSNGIHHHYSGVKFTPEFSQEFFVEAVNNLTLDSKEKKQVEEVLPNVLKVIFDPTYQAKAKNQAAGQDLLLTSAMNYYEGVTQAEAETFYAAMKDPNDVRPISYGLNSKLVKEDGQLKELTYRVGGLYSNPMEKIVYWLEKGLAVCENAEQKAVMEKLISFYRTGDLKEFDEYAVLWLNDTKSLIDYVCGYTETYGDPLGFKASWEAVINFKNEEASKRTILISDNAQWFEDHSPVAPQFKKPEVKGVTAKVINALMLGGDCYPTTPLGINLPNANWIRAEHGSKSVTIENVSEAYAASVKGTGFSSEFVWSDVERDLLQKYSFLTDNMHTDLHECLGHGSGQLLPGVDADALKEYGAVIEECRADLYGLYYIADPKMVELGLLPNMDAYKAQFYSYIQNGLLTQITRIKLGDDIEQTHMRNRQTIAKWVLARSAEDKTIELKQRDGKTFVVVNDYEKLRSYFAELLAEIQRIKSEGDYPAAKLMVETYGVKIDQTLHAEVLDRYAALNMSPYKAFVNPVYTAKYDENGKFIGLGIDYTEGFAEQHLRYSRDYSFLK